MGHWSEYWLSHCSSEKYIFRHLVSAHPVPLSVTPAVDLLRLLMTKREEKRRKFLLSPCWVPWGQYNRPWTALVPCSQPPASLAECKHCSPQPRGMWSQAREGRFSQFREERESPPQLLSPLELQVPCESGRETPDGPGRGAGWQPSYVGVESPRKWMWVKTKVHGPFCEFSVTVQPPDPASHCAVSRTHENNHRVEVGTLVCSAHTHSPSGPGLLEMGTGSRSPWYAHALA